MTPHDIAADIERLVRFQAEVGYLDRLQPGESEVREDTALLLSRDGTAVIAWLWPSRDYERGFDPFDAVASEDQSALGSAAEAFRGTEEPAKEQRRLVADRSRRIVELVAGACGHSVEDVKTHLEWSVPLARLALERLLDGRDAFSFSSIVGISGALQLEFESGWLVVQPERLARRIEHSVLASRIAAHLRYLTVENLESVSRKLPKGSADAAQATEPDLYLAPLTGSRYRPLYESLAADVRSAPSYSLAEIDRILVAAGEPALPRSARGDRSWWAGTGAKTGGRPQLSAWWAAGYRIQGIQMRPASGEITAIELAALPGRAEWLADPDRTAKDGYRSFGPSTLPIDPTQQSEGALGDLELRGWSEIVGTPVEDAPEDRDIRILLSFLKTHSGASRAEIEAYFTHRGDVPPGPSWISNLLTRARRQGWTVNLGTKSQPRWGASGLLGWAEL